MHVHNMQRDLILCDHGQQKNRMHVVPSSVKETQFENEQTLPSRSQQTFTKEEIKVKCAST